MINLLLAILIIALILVLIDRKSPAPPPPPPPPPPPGQGQHLTLVVQTTAVSSADVSNYLVAQNAQLANEFVAAWQIPAFIDLNPGGWPVNLLDTSDVPGALGYHDFSGTPYAKVFVLTSRQNGVTWQSVASHEVLEMLVDPGPNFLTVADAQGNLWDKEVGDPVEDTNDGSLSNFVTPDWFVSGSSTPWDEAGVLTHDHGITAGGYAVENGQQVFGPAHTSETIHVDKAYKRRNA